MQLVLHPAHQHLLGPILLLIIHLIAQNTLQLQLKVSNDRVHIVYYQSGAGHGLRHITLDASSNVYGYTISPDLPAGLKLDALTGEISGTALEISANTTYTITARNSGGFDTTTVTIEVVDQLPTVAYSPDDLQLTNNTVSVDLPLTPTLTGFGAITSWELNNTSLPSGILFGSNNGTFYGTPTELWQTTAYKVWANNTGGSSVAYLNITVVDEVPTLSYSPDNLVYGLASSDLPLAPSLTGQYNHPWRFHQTYQTASNPQMA